MRKYLTLLFVLLTPSLVLAGPICDFTGAAATCDASGEFIAYGLVRRVTFTLEKYPNCPGVTVQLQRKDVEAWVNLAGESLLSVTPGPQSWDGYQSAGLYRGAITGGGACSDFLVHAKPY